MRVGKGHVQSENEAKWCLLCCFLGLVVVCEKEGVYLAEELPGVPQTM